MVMRGDRYLRWWIEEVAWTWVQLGEDEGGLLGGSRTSGNSWGSWAVGVS